MHTFEKRKFYRTIRLGLAGLKKQEDVHGDRSEAQSKALAALRVRGKELTKSNVEYFYKEYSKNVARYTERLELLRGVRSELIQPERQPTTIEEYTEYKQAYEELMDATFYYMDMRLEDEQLLEHLKVALDKMRERFK